MAADGSLVLERPEHRVRDRFTVDEFMAMVEAKIFGDLANIELVEGEIIDMPPEGSGHGLNKAQTFRLLDRLVSRPSGLRIVDNVALRLSPAVVVAPDIMVVMSPEGRPSAIDAAAVRLAVEHALSTRNYDLNVKPNLYAAAGVAELWVLDDRDLLLHRFHSPRGGVYQRDPPRGLDEEVDVPFAPGERVRIGDLFDLD